MKKRFKRNYQSFLQKVGKSEATIDREFDKKHRKFIELEAYAAQVHNTVKIFLQNLQNCEKVSKELSLELSEYHANSGMEQKIASIKYKNVLDDISNIINDKTVIKLLVKKHSKIDTKKFPTNEKVEDVLESSTTSDYSSNSTVEEKTESETSSSESDSDNIEKQNQEIKEKSKIENEKTDSNENSSEDQEFSIYSYFSTGVDNTKKNRKIITVEISDIESDEESTSDTDSEID